MYYVLGLKHNLLSMSQMCNKGNNVVFTSTKRLVTNSKTKNLALKGKRYKNVYKADIMEPHGNNVMCLSVVDETNLIWHKKLGHASFSQQNKLVAKHLVLGLPKTRFNENIVCDACAREKHVRSSFKHKKWPVLPNPLNCCTWIYVDPCKFKEKKVKGICLSLLMIIQDSPGLSFLGLKMTHLMYLWFL